MRACRRRYAQLVAANAIRKLLTASWNQLQPSQRIEFRNYLLSHLVAKGPASEHFVTACLVQLVATLTKLSWMDSDEYQKIVPDICEFLHTSAEHLLLGLQLLQQLVAEMNSPSTSRSLALHRKISGHFRDMYLFTVFKMVLGTLQQLRLSGMSAAGDQQERVREKSLQLVFACLSYDFIGTTLDEASEDVGTIQVDAIVGPCVSLPCCCCFIRP